jgi:hypothetical protein
VDDEPFLNRQKWQMPLNLDTSDLQINHRTNQPVSDVTSRGQCEKPKTLIFIGMDKKHRILMLHGYSQNGALFRRKTTKLVQHITPVLVEHYGILPDEIDFIYPDGAMQLHLSSSTATIYDAPLCPPSSTQFRSWWQNLDTVSTYPGLEGSIAALKTEVSTRGPFRGVVGFSQGAALAAMFAAWCESSRTTGQSRSKTGTATCAYRSGDLEGLLATPPQEKLDFALLFSGYCGTAEHYGGFYEPKSKTPSVHIYGRFDTMVTKAQTFELVDAFEASEVVEHVGVHFVPSHTQTLQKVGTALSGVLRNSTRTTRAIREPHEIQVARIPDTSPQVKRHTRRRMLRGYQYEHSIRRAANIKDVILRIDRPKNSPPTSALMSCHRRLSI